MQKLRIKSERGNFAVSKNTDLFYLHWHNPVAKGIIVIVHGLGEHSGRYLHVGDFFSQAGFSVYIYDLRGHGRSAGIRCHVNSFEDYINDIKLFLNFIRSKENEKMVFVLGHSLGALIGLCYIQAYPDNIKGMILIAVPFELTRKIPFFKVLLAYCMSGLRPGYHLTENNLQDYYLSHDKLFADKYKSDPFICKKRSARFYTEFVKAKEYAIKGIGSIRIPALILVGGQDKIVSIMRIRNFYEGIGSKYKKFIEYKGFYHEILNEEGREKVMQDIVDWIGGINLCSTIF